MSDDQVNTPTFQHHLAELADGYFIKNEQIWRTIGTHPHNGDVDEKVSAISDDPKYFVQIQAWRLLQVLKGKYVNGKPHRMKEIPAHKECVDCGYGRR